MRSDMFDHAEHDGCYFERPPEKLVLEGYRRWLAGFESGSVTPWEMTNTVDLSFPGVKGERPFKVRFGNKFLKKVQIAATRDGKVTAAYFKAAGLVNRPESLMRPGFILRVLWRSLFGPSKESRQPYVWQAPAGVEPVFTDPANLPEAGTGTAAETPRAA